MPPYPASGARRALAAALIAAMPVLMLVAATLPATVRAAEAAAGDAAAPRPDEPSVVADVPEVPDRWTERLSRGWPEGVQPSPVVVAIWDRGVDTGQFPRQRIVDELGQPLTIGYDAEARRDDAELRAWPADTAAAQLGTLQGWLEGQDDLDLGVDTTAGREVQAALEAMPPVEREANRDRLQRVRRQVAGTHAASVVLDALPDAKLLAGRYDGADDEDELPCPTATLARRRAGALFETVGFFRRHEARVVLIGWRAGVTGTARVLEACNTRLSESERLKLAAQIVDVERRALAEAIRSSPQLLFVGTARADDDSLLPSAIALPNLVNVSAVDRSGAAVPSTRAGPEVVHANGMAVEGVLPGGTRMALGGTGVAAAWVAQTAARMWAVNPALAPSRIVELLRSTADRSDGDRVVWVHPARAVQAADAQRRARTNPVR